MTEAPPRDVLGLLTAQALAFGLSLALLIVPANSLFLDAYGSEWLPVTYIAIAIAGTAVAGLIARAARATRLVRLATASLGGLAALFVGLVGAAGGGRGLDVGCPARDVPDRAADRLRVHRRAGRAACSTCSR